MENSIESFFDWKTGKGKPIEERYKNHKVISQWERTDVLYSFIGIYKIGIFVFCPEECKRTKYTIKNKENKYFSAEYLKEHYTGLGHSDKLNESIISLNKAIIDSQFIKYIDSVGNIIPIWPGGNVDKGIMAYCFDIPDIYFKRYEKWFLAMQQLYPNACLDGIIDSAFSTDDTVRFLDSMNERTYCQFLEHVVKVIKDRTEYLNSI